MAQAFSSYGYQTITSDDLLAQGIIDSEELRQAKLGITAQAVKVARAVEADIALLGVLQLSQKNIVAGGIPVIMVNAEASAKAMVVSSGKLVQAFHHVERASALEYLRAYANSLDKIAKKISDILAWEIPHILTEEGRETRLIIDGVDISSANKIKESLDVLPGVEAVRFLRMPTNKESTSEFIMQTGFIRVSPEEILKTCTKIVGDSITLVKANKYEIEIRCCNKRP